MTVIDGAVVYSRGHCNQCQIPRYHTLRLAGKSLLCVARCLTACPDAGDGLRPVPCGRRGLQVSRQRHHGKVVRIQRIAEIHHPRKSDSSPVRHRPRCPSFQLRYCLRGEEIFDPLAYSRIIRHRIMGHQREQRPRCLRRSGGTLSG